MTVSIVGLGLIGGSMALSMRTSGFAQRLIGVDNNPEHTSKALELALVDAVLPLQEALAQSNLVVLAVPVDATVWLLPQVLDLVSTQTVIDVGGTKKPMTDAIKNHPKRHRFVATHPMAGTEFSGPTAAIHQLFEGKYTVLCNLQDSAPDAVALAQELYQTLGMKLTEMTAHAHDIHTAYISHVSHICSFALAITVLEKEKEEARIFELASSGFASTVRLAKSNPDTWIPIFRQNKENILDVLNEYINTLLSMKGLLIKDDYPKLRRFLEQGNNIKRILEK